jgi:hypothetical protein
MIEVAMHFSHPTFREVAIGLGLLRPMQTAEKDDALRKCAAYLEYRIRSSSTIPTLLDHQLAVAVLERWLTL